MGDKFQEAEVTMLLDQGVDLHSYQPTAEDILTISQADIFIYVGGESDKWVKDVIDNAVNSDMKVISLLDTLGDSVKEEEIVEGMEPEEEEAEADSEPDEHVWLSLRNAAVLVDCIADAIEDIDPANADLYDGNANACIKQLEELDAAYAEAVSKADVKTLIFGDRFPFLYLVKDYGLDYYAAFAGCSAETEASFETIIFLANKVNELGVHTILTLEGADPRIAETIRSNTDTKDQQILSLDSLQSVTIQDAENGTSYLSVMEHDLEILQEALK